MGDRFTEFGFAAGEIEQRGFDRGPCPTPSGVDKCLRSIEVLASGLPLALRCMRDARQLQNSAQSTSGRRSAAEARQWEIAALSKPNREWRWRYAAMRGLAQDAA